MIKAFSENDWNRKDKVLEDVNFKRTEFYDIWTALNRYQTELEKEEKFNRCNEIKTIINKIKKIIAIDLYNE